MQHVVGRTRFVALFKPNAAQGILIVNGNKNKRRWALSQVQAEALCNAGPLDPGSCESQGMQLSMN